LHLLFAKLINKMAEKLGHNRSDGSIGSSSGDDCSDNDILSKFQNRT